MFHYSNRKSININVKYLIFKKQSPYLIPQDLEDSTMLAPFEVDENVVWNVYQAQAEKS